MIQKPKKRVLILGAGASAASDFHLPVMSGFFEPNQGAYPELFRFLNWFYPNISIDDYNLEEVLAFLELSKTRLPIWGVERSAPKLPNYETIYDQVLAYVTERLKIPAKKTCSLHQRLFERLASSDTVLTLNYDLIADQTLLEVEPKNPNGRPDPNCRMEKLEGLLQEKSLYGGDLQPPSLMPREREWGFYLKLHGSLDWLYCPTVGCRNHVNIFSLSASRLSEGQETGQPCRFCGAALRTMIVPPIATKRLEDRGRTSFHWNLALRELRSAKDVVIIGLSLAPSDFELRWLLRESLSMISTDIQLHIVNTNPSHREAVKNTVPIIASNALEYNDLEEYLRRIS